MLLLLPAAAPSLGPQPSVVVVFDAFLVGIASAADPREAASAAFNKNETKQQQKQLLPAVRSFHPGASRRSKPLCNPQDIIHTRTRLDPSVVHVAPRSGEARGSETPEEAVPRGCPLELSAAREVVCPEEKWREGFRGLLDHEFLLIGGDSH
jgi:hypothetical protein